MLNLSTRSSGCGAYRLALGLVVWGAILSGAAVAAPADEKKDASFVEKMEQWQEKMSEKFRDTWKTLRRDNAEGALGTASVDLRENNDHYTLRLNLPNRELSKVEVRLEGETLRIVAPAGEKVSRYEQTLALVGVRPGAELKIDRKPEDHMVVVTVPKGKAAASKSAEPGLPDPALSPLSDWDRDVFVRMEKMRREMDRVFEEAFWEFRGSPEFRRFFDEPRFGSTMDLKDEGANYVVRAYLPDRDVEAIDVTLQDRVLKIEAKEQGAAKNEGEPGVVQNRRKAAFSQLLTLPGPVQSDKMKVEKKDAMLVITLPKAM